MLAIDRIQISMSVATDRVLYDCVATDHGPMAVSYTHLDVYKRQEQKVGTWLPPGKRKFERTKARAGRGASLK